MSLPAGLSATALMHVVYLHGFASGANSTKAAWFAKRLHDAGASFHCPDFNAPDFATLTISRMLDQLGAVLATVASPVALIGSSLGGTLAMLAADRFEERVDRVVLLAPAVMFGKPGHHLLPPERVEEWRQKGALPFFHHGYQAERLLNFAFYADSLRHDACNVSLMQPTLAFQGRRDASVDFHTVEQFARMRPNLTLSLLDDDHQLIASLPRIWDDVAPFLAGSW